MEACAAGEDAKSGSESDSLDRSLSKSSEIVLVMLDEHRLSRLKATERERLSSSIPFSVTVVQLTDVGVTRFGNRQTDLTHAISVYDCRKWNRRTGLLSFAVSTINS